MAETRTVRAVIIPADETKPIEYRAIAAELETFKSLVGGWIEAVTLSAPDAVLFCNEEGKLFGLPTNPRATRLAWAHGFTGRDVLAGDVFIVGADGETETDCPAEYEAVARRWDTRSDRTDATT